jgi:hypothetical protein
MKTEQTDWLLDTYRETGILITWEGISSFINLFLCSVQWEIFKWEEYVLQWMVEYNFLATFQIRSFLTLVIFVQADTNHNQKQMTVNCSVQFSAKNQRNSSNRPHSNMQCGIQNVQYLNKGMQYAPGTYRYNRPHFSKLSYD